MPPRAGPLRERWEEELQEAKLRSTGRILLPVRAHELNNLRWRLSPVEPSFYYGKKRFPTAGGDLATITAGSAAHEMLADLRLLLGFRTGAKDGRYCRGSFEIVSRIPVGICRSGRRSADSRPETHRWLLSGRPAPNRGGGVAVLRNGFEAIGQNGR